MSGSGRRIHVSRVANGDGVFFHVPDGTLEQENLKSQFPCAFGLKYLLQGQWVAVTVHNSKFQIPEEISHFVVVTETIDKARSVLGNQSLARQVSSVFGRSFANEEASTSLSSASPVTISSAPSVSGHTYRPSASVPTCSWSDAKFRQNLSRKQTRTLFSKKSKFPKTKVFKVVFVEKTDLPTSFSKSLVMCEGFLTVTDAEHEDEILNNMQAILKNSNLGFEDANEVKILTYSSRTLALPCLAAGFRWSLETLKTNVGQGKMYVMVHLNYMEAHTSSGDEVESDRTDPGLMTPEVHDSSGKSDDGDFEELGTPTVLRNIRKQRPLSEEAESDLPVAKVQQTDRRTFRPLSLLNLSERRAPVENHSDVSASSSTSAVAVSGSVFSPVEVVDSEDEELQKVIEESTKAANQRTQATQDGVSLQEVIKEFQEHAVDANSTKTMIVIFRSNVLDSLLRALDRKSINLKSRLYVKFSGEIGEDHGGPRREFFRLALISLQESRFFDGPETAKYFSHDLGLLEKGHYRLVGRLVGLSLAQDGPGLHFFSTQLFDIMVGNEADLKCVESLLPPEVNDIIKQLEDIDTDEKKDKFLVEHGDRLIDQGFPNPYRMTVENKVAMIHMMKKHHLYYRTSGEIAQFEEGMNEVSNAWDVVKAHADLFKPLFCYTPEPLTADEMMKLFDISYSAQGSNDRALEDTTVYAWELFLQSIEGEEVPVTFPDLLTFITGADHVPPCGFKTIDIQFYSQDEGVCRLPHTSTCALILWLPRINNVDSFSPLLVRSLKDSRGFLKI